MKIILDAANNPHHKALQDMLIQGVAHADANKITGQTIQVTGSADGAYTGMTATKAGNVVTIELIK